LERDGISDSWMQPRDILTPAATLLGLVLAAIGLSSAIAGASTILQTLSIVLIFIVVLFAGAALATCVASLRRSHRVLRVAVVLFAIGWAFTGMIVCLLLLGYAWGIQIFQIPVITVPQFTSLNIESILSIAGAVFSFLVALYSYRGTRIKQQLETLVNSLAADRDKTQAIVRQTLDVDPRDPKMAFVRLTIDLEKALRKRAVSDRHPERDARSAPVRRIADYLRSKGTVDSETADSINRIWNVRNMILHSGADISDRDAAAAVNLAAAVLSRLGVR